MNKKECLQLGIQYIEKHSCYPAAKGWTVKTAGCSRDRIYENWDNWPAFITDLKEVIEIPNTKCYLATPNKPEKKDKPCKVCGVLTYSRNIYCSNTCQHEQQYRNKIAELLEGNFSNCMLKSGKTSWLRRYLIERNGESCSMCGIGNTYNNKPLLLEIDHINGRCHNNIIENLRFLCPNCHSQTDTYKAKNKVSDHKTRYVKSC